ncbi:hypothetical protein LOK49_LG15G00299 [Camellia lanceoleosa]|uniref:Uncharacterized protein n=1 Tax=Camellia lanceoleosa TaxID=1840588 RepID=A0ACC0F3G8_9ERIC|nr:hypothetical protein LOK49_LG15G00299 [Camellia lanceoleosa]
MRPNTLVNTDVDRFEGVLGSPVSCAPCLTESGRDDPFGLGGHRRGSMSQSGMALVVHPAAQGSRLVEASEKGISQSAVSSLVKQRSMSDLHMPCDLLSAGDRGSDGDLSSVSDREISQSAAMILED